MSEEISSAPEKVVEEQADSINLLPLASVPITKDSSHSRNNVNYPFKGTIIFKSWNVGETNVPNNVCKSVYEAFKDELAGFGTVWINSIVVNVCSWKSSGVLGMAIHSSQDTYSSPKDLFFAENRKFISFNRQTVGMDLEYPLSWPTSVGRQISPYDPQYNAPHIALCSTDVEMIARVVINVDHTKHIINGSSF